MKKTNFKIVRMKLPEDKDEIVSWGKTYKGTEGFKAIEHFILEDNTYHGLDEVILVNYEFFPIGDNERQYSYVAKDENDEIIAWILMDLFDITTTNPQLFLQYLMINPKFQHRGLGTEIFSEILLKPEKYVAQKPTCYFGYVHKENFASKGLLNKFGFSLNNMSNSDYFKAETNMPRLETSSEPEPI